MNNFVMALLIMLATASSSGAAQSRHIDSAKAKLVGTWKLVSRAVKQQGKVMQDSLGNTPVGYLMYDTTGHMGVQLMRRSRPPHIDCARASSGQSDNSPQFVNGYEAYFGTYKVDEEKQTVTHHLEGAIAARDIGKSLIRNFKISGDTLTIFLTTDSPQGTQTRTLIWERIKTAE